MSKRIKELESDIEKVMDYLPEYVTTIYDIQACLGAAVLSDKSGEIPLNVAMRTSFEKMHETIGTSDSIVIINLKEEDDELMLEGIDVEDYTSDSTKKHPFVKGYNWGTGQTVTHYSNDKTPTEMGYKKSDNELVRRSSQGGTTYTPLTAVYKWADKAVECSFCETHSIPEWLELLRDIPESTIKDVEDGVRDSLPETEFSGFVSIRIDEKNPIELESYEEIYNSMVRSDKEEYSGGEYRSVGVAPDMTTGSENTVLGINNDAPWDYHTTKTRENHPQFNPDLNWRHRPLSFETSLLMDAGQNIVEDYFTYEMMFGSGDNTTRVYYYSIPYPIRIEVTPRLISEWYIAVDRTFGSDSDDWKPQKMNRAMTMVESDNSDESNLGDLFGVDLDESNYEDNLNAIFLSVQREGGNVDNEMYTSTITKNELRELENSVKNAVKSRSPDIGMQNSSIQNPDFERFKLISSTLLNPKWHANETCYKQGDENRKRDSQSVEFQIVQALLSDSELVSYHTIIQAFSQQLVTSLYNEAGVIEDSDGEYKEKFGFFDSASNQDITLGVLLATDSLSNYRPKRNSVDIESLSPVLRGVLNSRPEIRDTTAIYPFVLGRAIGEISHDQSEDGVSNLMYKRNPIDTMNISSFQNVVGDVINKILTYSAQNNNTLNSEENRYAQFQYEMSDISRILKEYPNPHNWNLEGVEMKYFYGLGIASSLLRTTSETE